MLLLIATLGCTPGDTHGGGQQGEETEKCTAVSHVDLAADEASSLGFSPNDVLAYAAGAQTAPLTWAKGGDTTATLDFEPGGAMRFVHYEWQDDGSGLVSADIGCSDQVEIDGTLGFQTADGAFDESFPLTLAAPTADSAAVYVQLDLAHLHGTYTVTEVDPAAYDGITAYLDATFAAAGPHGTIQGQATQEDTATASATSFDIASW